MARDWMQPVIFVQEEGTKVCTRCHISKPIDKYTKSKKGRDGYASACRTCLVERARLYREQHCDLVRQQSAAQHQLHTDWYKNYKKIERKRPQHWARRTLEDAVSHGRITKPTTCERCGTEVLKQKIQGHHNDYTKPFEVIWLCSKCHAKEHRGLTE
jgi:hypothetical protein